METKHTPGPWDQSGASVWGVDQGLDVLLANCYLDGTPTMAVCMRNAKLMASAPDHHKNAIWADNMFSGFANNPAFREVLDAFGYCQSFDDWMKSNRAAIAKAQGK